MSQCLFFPPPRKVEWVSCRSDGNESPRAECHTNKCIMSLPSSLPFPSIRPPYFYFSLGCFSFAPKTVQRSLSGPVTDEGRNCSDLSCARVKGVCRPAISHHLRFPLQTGSISEPRRRRSCCRAALVGHYAHLERTAA